MSFQPEIPARLRDVLAKPGRQRTAEERDAVKVWLATDRMIANYMIMTAVSILGNGLISQDAEDVWQSFLAKKLDGAVSKTSTPTKAIFGPI